MRDASMLVGIVPVRSGGTGVADVGAVGTVLTSDGVAWRALDGTTNPFLSAAAIFVDPGPNGSDSANGLQQLPQSPAQAVQNPGPLKTWGELRRRIGSGKLTGNPVITVLGDLPSTDPMLVDFGTTGTCTIVGTATVTKATGNSSAFTGRVPATNTPNQFSDGATVWTTFIGIGQIVAILSGPAAGGFAYGVKDQGAGVLRTGSFFALANSLELTPAGVQSYQIQQFSRTTTAAAGITQLQPTAGTSFLFENLRINRPRFGGDVPMTFANCAFTGSNALNLVPSSLTFLNCDLSVPMTLTLCSTTIVGGVIAGGGQTLSLIGGVCTIIGGLLLQDTSQIAVSERCWVDFADVMAFDGTFAAAAGGSFSFKQRASGLFEVVSGTTAVANAVPCVIDGSSQVDMTAANNRTYLGTNPAAAVKIGTSATLAAWPAAVASKTVDVNSDATLVHA